MGKFVCHRTQQISERWSKPKTCIEKEHNREQKMIYLPAFGASYPSFRHLLLFCYRWPVSAERLSDDRNRKQTLWLSLSLSLVLAIDSWEVFDTHPISQWLPPFLGFTIFLQNARIQQTITKRPPTKHNSFALAQLEWWFSLDFFCGRRSSTEEEEEKKNGFYFSYVTDFRIEKQQKKIHHSPKRIVFLFFFVRRGCVTRTVVHSHTQPYKRESCISTRARILSTWHFRKKQTTIYCCSWIFMFVLFEL